ncbi:ATP-binding protein [Mesorhizobium sp. M0664]|uniref:ATP-binding protein n=1 Tax=Mesorhizobium sp. M0664 TaxID=2956982 RepID=UPI003335F5FC
MAERNNANELSRDEWLGLMLDREVAIRADNRVRNRLASARLRFPEACIEDIDLAAPRGLDRRSTMALAQGEWLKAHENLIVTGQTEPASRGWPAPSAGKRHGSIIPSSMCACRACSVSGQLKPFSAGNSMA